MTPKAKRSSLIFGILAIALTAMTGAVAYTFYISKRPAVSDTIEKNVILGREGMGFYAEEFSGPLVVADPLVNLPAFSAIGKALSSRGINLSVVIVPIKSRIYEDHMPQPLPEIVNNRYDLFRNALEANGIHTPDINAYLLQHPARNSKRPFYFFADTHWTPQAAVDIGEFVAKEISQRVNLNTVPTMAATKQSEPAQISGLKQLLEGSGDGDLIRLSTPDNPAHTQIKPLTEVLLTTLETKTELLEETPEPRIVQTGTSYSIYPALADGLRNGLQRDVLLLARDGGWYGTLKEYLASKQYQTTPPRVMVWEYPERYLSLQFEARDPEKMVADTLGWCEEGTRPIEIKLIKSDANSITYNLDFERPIAGSYISLKTGAPSGTTLTISNPEDKSSPTILEKVKLSDAPGTQALLDRISKVPTKRLHLKFETEKSKAAQINSTMINDPRICSSPLR
jgi:alginate O-acetyltransferase complex protein AlgJ